MGFMGGNRGSSNNSGTIITTALTQEPPKDQSFPIHARLLSLRRSTSTVCSQSTAGDAHHQRDNDLSVSVFSGRLSKEDPNTLKNITSRGTAEKKFALVFPRRLLRDVSRAPQDAESRSYNFAKVLSSVGGNKSGKRSSMVGNPATTLHMNGYDDAGKDDKPVFKWTKVEDQCVRGRIAHDSISYPSNFHHVTHTKAKQFTNITATSQSDLVAEFSAVRASQIPRREIRGFQVRDIQSCNSSVDIFANTQHSSTVPSLSSESSNSINSPGPSSRTSQQSLWTSRSKDSFSQPFLNGRSSNTSIRSLARTSSRPPSVRAVADTWLNACYEHFPHSTPLKILELLELEDDSSFHSDSIQGNSEVTKNDRASATSCEATWQIGIAISPACEVALPEQSQDTESDDHVTMTQLSKVECVSEHKSAFLVAPQAPSPLVLAHTAYQNRAELPLDADDDSVQVTTFHNGYPMLRMPVSPLSCDLGTLPKLPQSHTYKRVHNSTPGQDHENKALDLKVAKAPNCIANPPTPETHTHMKVRDGRIGSPYIIGEHGTLSPRSSTTTRLSLDLAGRPPQRRHTMSQRISSRSIPAQTDPPNRPLPDIPTLPRYGRRSSNPFMTPFPSPLSVLTTGAL